MAMNLEVEAWAGRAHHDPNLMAARTWVALVEDVVPFEDIPHVQTLCRLAIERIGSNLFLGFNSQEEANQAQLEYDTTLQDLSLDDEPF